MKTPKILIIGNSESGKSTAARILAQYFSCGWTGTSQIILDKIAGVMCDGHISRCEFMRQIKLHPDFGPMFRIFLRDVGNKLRENDPAALAKACLERGPIVEGVRTMAEFAAGYFLFDLILWIDAPDTKPNDTDELSQYFADLTVRNDRDEAFRHNLIATIEKWVEVRE